MNTFRCVSATIFLSWVAPVFVTAQTELPRVTTNIAFLKNPNGFIIDSITVSTTLDPNVYGFSFPGDTLVLDLEIFSPIDELSLQTFGGGHSFGAQRCWVDAPTADVYLSVDAGRGKVDSVGLSPVEQWFRQRVKFIVGQPTPNFRMAQLIQAASLTRDNLMSASMLSTYLQLPNTVPRRSAAFREALQGQPASLRRHPQMAALLQRLEVMAWLRPPKLKKLRFLDPAGTPAELPPITGQQFTVLNYYRSADQRASEEHTLMRQLMTRDSLFRNINLLSISDEASTAFWQLYVRDNAFGWKHFQEIDGPKGRLADQLYLFSSGPTYLLLNPKGLVVGIYPSLEALAKSIRWRRTALQRQRRGMGAGRQRR